MLKKLICPNCGGKLLVEDRAYLCPYCGIAFEEEYDRKERYDVNIKKEEKKTIVHERKDNGKVMEHLEGVLLMAIVIILLLIYIFTGKFPE